MPILAPAAAASSARFVAPRRRGVPGWFVATTIGTAAIAATTVLATMHVGEDASARSGADVRGSLAVYAVQPEDTQATSTAAPPPKRTGATKRSVVPRPPAPEPAPPDTPPLELAPSPPLPSAASQPDPEADAPTLQRPAAMPSPARRNGAASETDVAAGPPNDAEIVRRLGRKAKAACGALLGSEPLRVTFAIGQGGEVLAPRGNRKDRASACVIAIVGRARFSPGKMRKEVLSL
jgi:hypothetical protein